MVVVTVPMVFFQILPPSRADDLGDDDLPCVGEAHAQGGGEPHELGGDAHGAESLAPHELAYHHHVHHAVSRLEQGGEHEGQGEADELFGHAAHGKVLNDRFCHNAFLTPDSISCFAAQFAYYTTLRGSAQGRRGNSRKDEDP